MSSRVLDAEVGIVGGGPAGMAAAARLRAAGLSVIVLDEGHRAGGQIFRQLPLGASGKAIAEPPSHHHGHTLLAAFGLSRAELRSGAVVWDARPGRLWFEQDGHCAVLMPGVPHEMKAMWTESVRPLLMERQNLSENDAYTRLRAILRPETIIVFHDGFRLLRWGDWFRRAGMRNVAEKHKLTMIQLASIWNLSQPAVHSVIPTIIQEADPKSKPIEAKVEELAKLPDLKLSADECAYLAEVGNNKGCMALKGANRSHTGEPEADHWGLNPDLEAVGKRWGIDPDKDLVCTHTSAA